MQLIHGRLTTHSMPNTHSRLTTHNRLTAQQAGYPQQADYSQQADYPPLGDAFCQLAVSQPLSPLGPAMHMHALTHKKDSSDLDMAAAPPQVGEEFADRLGSCTAQPYGCLQRNQQ